MAKLANTGQQVGGYFFVEIFNKDTSAIITDLIDSFDT